ncbi:MAG: PaaI family thioesterase [Actinomycetales bacterium]|nr:PaaI family thioesterase [Actinomycetales bacterium]
MSSSQLQEFLAREFPEIGGLDLRVEHVDERCIRVRLPAHESTLRPGGTISGPTMFTLADVCVYLLVLAQIGPVALAVTTSVGMNFLRKPAPGDLIAEGELLKLGSRLAVGHVRIHAEGSQELVADASLTYSIPPR